MSLPPCWHHEHNLCAHVSHEFCSKKNGEGLRTLCPKEIQQLEAKLKTEKETSQSLAHDLVRTADHLETFSPGERGRKSVSEDYKTTAYWLLVSKRDVKKLEIEIMKAKGETISPEALERLNVAEKFVERAELKL
jgi:hypothetical protein